MRAAPPCRLTVLPGHTGQQCHRTTVNDHLMEVFHKWGGERAGFHFFCPQMPFAKHFLIRALFTSPTVSRVLVQGETRGFLLEAAGFAAKAPSYVLLIVV